MLDKLDNIAYHRHMVTVHSQPLEAVMSAALSRVSSGVCNPPVLARKRGAVAYSWASGQAGSTPLSVHIKEGKAVYLLDGMYSHPSKGFKAEFAKLESLARSAS